MSAFERIEIDYDGVADVLRSPELHAAVQAAAEQVADAARGRGLRVESGEPLPVEVFDDPGPSRVGVTVAIRHPSGVGMEAHHGVLKRAAGETGLSVGGLDPDNTA
ncbi:hypothetical protein [Amycolatopsis sp. MtRt-6]|uniref:hypothetical protein n=1 Tax=Amycolatopsis sp. MtRt-6 TaxID=2792782 RepID=UPI001A90BF7C|nr:hypothetical protein [Amycolatopsis sp. MtRt-6]